MEKNTICYAPYINLHINSLGYVNPCCMNGYTSFGNINENTIDNILNGDKIKEFKNDMLQGKIHRGCVDCFNAEKNGLHSYRQYFDDIVKQENIDVNLYGKNDIYYVDLRITNKCNLRCRMCVSQSSILLAHDMKKLGFDVNPKELVSDPAKDFESLIKELDKKLENLKIVYFAGGEPSVMDEQYTFINYLIEKKLAKHIKVYVTSNINLKTLTYKEKNYIDLLKNFKSVYFTVSIDGIYERGEYIRKNLNYTTWKENFKKLIDEKNNSNGFFNVNTYSTIGMYNLLHVFDLVEEILNLNGDDPDNINLNPLSTPEFYNADVLPMIIKDEFSKKLEVFISKYKDKKYNKLINNLVSLKKHIYSNDNTNRLDEFFDFNDKMDMLRNEDFFHTFPELSILNSFKRL